ncbi:MAG: hypothetical protein IJS22_01525 [Lachnospiraceae bacterium]|nr:hypothetical protein [Lachnospiraceae bacterium]
MRRWICVIVSISLVLGTISFFPKVTTADQPEDTVSSGYSVSMPGEEPVDEAIPAKEADTVVRIDDAADSETYLQAAYP